MGNMMNDNSGYDRMVAGWTIISEGQLFDWRIPVISNISLHNSIKQSMAMLILA